MGLALSGCSYCGSAEAPSPVAEPVKEASAAPAAPDAGDDSARWVHRFDQPLTSDWVTWTHQLDAQQGAIRVDAHGLRMELETYGRPHAEVSVTAAAWKEALDFSAQAQTMTVQLDWLEDSNASYLSAGLAIVPEDAELKGDPRDLPQVTHLSFIGVGPGATARRELLVQRQGQELARDTEGWPEVEREGRHLKSVSVRLVVSGDLIRIEEEGRAPVSVKSSLGFARGRLVLFAASHSNSMRRAVRFTQLRVD